jgi:hypothetical protein
MTDPRCSREDELLEALSRGFVGAELMTHVDACTACSELHVVAGALLDDRADAFIDAPLPASGTMLWRMQLRQRQEAESAARRSLFIGQAVTLAVALTLVASLLGVQFAGGLREVIATVRLSTPLLICVGALFVFGPIAGVVAIRQK